MSTKTTFKRVALVAVAALGFGTLSSVAPATAVERTPSIISVVSDGALRAGVAGSLTATFTLPSGYAIGDSIIVGARVTSAPAASFATSKAAVPGTAAISSSASTLTGFGWAKASSGSGSYGSTSVSGVLQSSAGDNLPGVEPGVHNWTTSTAYVSATGDSTATQSLTLNFTPDAAGSYTIMFFVGSGAAAYNTAAKIQALSTANIAANLSVTSLTVSTGSTPTKATITSVSGTTITGSTGGSLFKLALTDDAGAAASLGSGETITLSSTTSTVSFHTASDNSTAITTARTNAHFSGGVMYFTVKNSATGTASFSATGSGLLSTAVTGSGAVVTVAGSAGAPTIAKLSTNTALTTTGETAATTTQINYAKSTTATSASLVVTGTAANVEALTVTDTSGKITGAANIYVVPVTIGTLGTATVSLLQL